MGVKRIWTDEQKADIKYLYEEEGWTIKQIEKNIKVVMVIFQECSMKWV